MYFQSFGFTALLGDSVVSSASGNLGVGDMFDMPASATVQITVTDNDRGLSGDSWLNEYGNDLSGQRADIEIGGVLTYENERIYAEQYHVLSGDDGETYYLIEIERAQSGSTDAQEFFAFFGPVPPIGTGLGVVSTHNVIGNWVQYKNLSAGLDWTPDTDGKVTIEAEDMRLSNYRVDDVDAASGGEVIKLKRNEGEASLDFGGADGTYDLEIAYVDENDGQGSIDVQVNGVVVATISLDQDTNGNGNDHSTISSLVIPGLELAQGDTITLVGHRDAWEFARIDALTFCAADMNADPVAVDDGFTGTEDSQITGNVLDNDSDADGDVLQVTLVGDVAHGSLVLNPDGSFTYDPDPDFNGTDSFTYQVSDGQGGVSTATVTLTLDPVNDAPELADGNLAATEDGAAVTLDLSALGSDADAGEDGTTLTYTLVGPAPGQGSVSITGTTLSFDPGADFQDLAEGATVDILVTVQAQDSSGAVTTGTVTVTVTGTNDAPVATPDLTITDQNTVLTGNLFADNTAGSDFDPDGDSFTIFEVDGAPPVFDVPIALSGGGILTLSANGDFTFDPNGDFDFVGAGQASANGIFYRVVDSNGAVSNEVRANFSVTGVNDAPVAVDDAFTLDEDSTMILDLTANDSDADLTDTVEIAMINGVAVSVGDVVATSSGSLVVLAGGSVEFTPNANYSGPDSFTYQISDGTALSPEAVAQVSVTPVADAPTVSIAAGGGGTPQDLTPTPGATDTQINAVTDGFQGGAAVTALADGGYAVTWDSTEDGGNSVRLQIHNEDGSVRVPAQLVDAPGSVFHQISDVFQTANGEIVVVNRGSDGVQIGEPFFQRFDANGNRIGGQESMTLLPNETGDGDAFRDRSWDSVHGTGLEGGGFVSVFQVRLSEQGQPNSTQIYASVFDDAGNAVQVDLLLANSTDQIFRTTVTHSPGGGFVVAWNEGNTVFARTYDAVGTATGPAITVNETDLALSGSAGTNSEIYVTTLANGNFVVSWSGDEASDFSEAANFRIYAPDGTALTGQIRANSDVTGQQRDQSVTALDDGGFIVTYRTVDSPTLFFAQRFDAAGVAVGDEYQVAADGSATQGGSLGGRYAATLGNGDVVTIWTQGELFQNIAQVPSQADGIEDQPLALDLSAALGDPDGSETLTITLSGFPAGATFNLGVADGSDWVITGAEALDLSTLVMQPPVNFNGTFTLTATATATEIATGATASTSDSVDLTIADVVDPALFTDGADFINFGNPAAASFGLVTAGSYAEGSQYNALDGNDQVYLPQTLADAAAAGYDLSQAFRGGNGNDFIVGSFEDDLVFGDDGNDQLRGDLGDDTLMGGAGNDNILGGAGDDSLDGGAGRDILNYSQATGGVTVDMANGIATGDGTDTFQNFESVFGSVFGDTGLGSTGNDVFRMFGGDDTILAGDGSDILWGGTGDDMLDGGVGIDRATYQDASSAVTVNLTLGTATGGAGNDTLVDIEQVLGSNHDDVLIGTDDGDNGLGFGIGSDALFGLGGDDLIMGLGGDDDLSEAGDGDDSVYGGDGNDLLGGGAGNDLLDGGAGVDGAYYANTFDGVNINLATGVATQAGDTDTLISIENVTGSVGNDTITGDSGDNVLNGWFGDDQMTGGLGADTFFFDTRKDFSGNNLITDFEIGVDQIHAFGSDFNTLSDLNPVQQGADTLLTLTNGTTVLLQDILVADLSDSDFIF